MLRRILANRLFTMGGRDGFPLTNDASVSARALLPGTGRRVRDDDPFSNLALEEAIFLRNKGLVLRVWENRESVIIGRAQLAEFETDVRYCRDHGIPIVRRFTAGGTVYNGPGNVNWSLFVGRSTAAGPVRYDSSPHAIFRIASRPVLGALSASGVTARLEPPNSIVTPEGKVSGMAAYVSRGGFLCHGTLLVGADLGRVKALTTPADRTLQRRYTRSRDVKTANAEVEVDSFIRTLVRTLADETRLKVEVGALREDERELAEELLLTRYGEEGWNLGDPFESGSSEDAGSGVT
ncbi:MAG TPA: lipoate--protein ligase family protein [Nitrososphaerales archaeon]|nr:lipoate--protein ligase family protein [Nitrososphaerales archaeon]